jgi:uncharacterized protein (DUF4213/DUF364 family)
MRNAITLDPRRTSVTTFGQVARSFRRAVGIAAMNALADMCWERRPTAGVDLCTGVNAYDAAEIRAGENVVVVGAFVPFLKSLKRAHQRFTVLEWIPRR